MLNCSNQGASVPSRENCFRALGSVQGLVELLLKAVCSNRVVVEIQVSREGYEGSEAMDLLLSDVATIEISFVFWTRLQVENQYGGLPWVALVTWEGLYESDREYTRTVLGCEPSPAWSALLPDCMSFFRFERGATTKLRDNNHQPVTYLPPSDYVPFK